MKNTVSDGYAGISYYWDEPLDGKNTVYKDTYSFHAEWEAGVFYDYIRQVLVDSNIDSGNWSYDSLFIDPRADDLATRWEVFDFSYNIALANADEWAAWNGYNCLTPAVPVLQNPPSSAPVWAYKIYSNTQYGFTLRYPTFLIDSTKQWFVDGMVEPGFVLLKRFTVPGKNTANDDGAQIYADIEMTVGTSPDAITSCSDTQGYFFDYTKNISYPVIHGIQFTSYDGYGNAAGQRIGGRVFQTIHNNICYHIEILETGSVFVQGPNADPQTAQDEATKYHFPFNANQVFDTLTPVAESFSFSS